MKITIYEHVSGGGYAEKPIPPDVLAEGFAMLRCVAADFKAAGHEVTVFLDARLSKLNPPLEADNTIPIIYANEAEMLLAGVASVNDAVYVIAPETAQTLHLLVKRVEATGKISLNSTSEAIAKVSDKSILYELLQKNGVVTPKTVVLNINDNVESIGELIKQQFSYPLVFKPADGTSCSGISLLQSPEDIENALFKIKAESKNPHFIAQEYLQGEPVSVSIICNGKKAIALSLNKQNIHLAQPKEASIYEGGCVPFKHHLKNEAYETAQTAVESFPGLRGYVGVDLILANNKVFVLDVNARLTTSYIGLRQVVDINLAQEIIEAVVKGKVPDTRRLLGEVCFSKIQTRRIKFGAYERYQKATKLGGIVSPPFPLKNYAEAASLIMGYGDTIEDAQLRLEEAKKLLCNIFR